ncbi:hypothetical protein [Undibacterium fentianense]|uniref:Uncharacterized protein n=1 Tax=Undibacterium fentianense TaxID=2828728 RepID=A0A941E0Y3_9BURK|nr:hypothetical protein [Undibacterium fentianense]MBR7800395.1 hypothetical protein [Undibacterium fentianense]
MIDFSEMLPVGMVAHGGQVARIMADIAQRQRGLENWEAFHYEKISDSAVELTGGIVSIQNGSKRWLEPHDCITIPLAAVFAEMQKQGLVDSPAVLPMPHLNALNTANPPTMNGSDVVSSGSHAFLHLKLALPSDQASRQKILSKLHLEADLLGATVIACHLE